MDVWAEYLGDSRREVSRGHKGLEKPNGAWGSTQGQKSDKDVPSKTRRPVTTLLETGEPLQFLPVANPAVRGYEKVRRQGGI